jgi:hypothetical protein
VFFDNNTEIMPEKKKRGSSLTKAEKSKKKKILDARERRPKKKEREEGPRARKISFSLLLQFFFLTSITVSFCLYLEREKNDREDARIAEKNRERDFLLSPVSF